MRGYFITGTDTDAGKTWISLAMLEALQRQGYRVGVMKPVSAGCARTAEGLRNDDAVLLQQRSNVKLAYDEINPFAFEHAIAPHIAAEETGVRIDIETLHQQLLTISDKSDCVVVEGAGGWQVPLNDFQTMADLARRFELPVIMVVGLRLGCLNHALLTAESIRTCGLPLAGWVANQLSPQMDHMEENIRTLEQMIDAPLLGHIPWLETLDVAAIADRLTPPPERHGLRPAWTT